MATIAIDLDSTLNNLGEMWLARYNYDYDDTLTQADMRDWDWDKHVKPACGTKIYDYLRDPYLFLDCTPLSGAINEVGYLKDQGHDLLVITSCHPANEKVKRHWIDRYFPGMFRTVLTVENMESKYAAATLAGEQIDYLIDDGAHNFVDWQYPTVGVLLDAPWNRDTSEMGDLAIPVFRCADWRNIGHLLDDMIGQTYGGTGARADWPHNGKAVKTNFVISNSIAVAAANQATV